MQLHTKPSQRQTCQLRLLPCLLLFIFQSSWAQMELHWNDLTMGINLSLVIEQGVLPQFEPASFSPKMRALEGEKVTMTGYFLVLDSQLSRFMLSKNPMASCFFCGNGGPETVMDLRFKEYPKFKMDDVISVEGILRLNEDSPESSYYILEEVTAFKFN